MRNKLIGTVTAGLIAASAAVFGFSAPALAANTGRSDACVSWACGSSTMTFTGKRTINPVYLSIKDTSCNGSLAYVRLRIHYVNGTSEYTTKRNAYSACGEGYRTYTTSWNGSKDIRAVEVYVGDSVNGQKGGNAVDNSYT